MPEIIVCDEHSQVYDVWRERSLRDLRVSHVDFHCDMSGLFIDRKRSRASFIDGTVPGKSIPHSGNFLGHAIVEGIVSSLRWIHDPFGGRNYDTGTVKYETDLSTRLRRILRRHGTNDVPIQFEELVFDDWKGPSAGEHLDIDWDGLASIEYDLDHIQRLTEGLLRRDFPIPDTTYLVYSPGYSHPDRDLYENFIERLADKLGADVVRLPLPKLRPGYPKPPQDVTGLARLKQEVVLRVHRAGIH